MTGRAEDMVLDDDSYQQVSTHSDATRDIAVALHKTAKSEKHRQTLEKMRESEIGGPTLNTVSSTDSLPRRASWSHADSEGLYGVGKASDLAQPGGFRRAYVKSTVEEGEENSDESDEGISFGQGSGNARSPKPASPMPPSYQAGSDVSSLATNLMSDEGGTHSPLLDVEGGANVQSSSNSSSGFQMPPPSHRSFKGPYQPQQDYASNTTFLGQLLRSYDAFVVNTIGDVDHVEKSMLSMAATVSPLHQLSGYRPLEDGGGDEWEKEIQAFRESLKGETSRNHLILGIMKSMVGSGVLFLPRAFANGGWLASSIGLVIMAIISVICMNLLVDCSIAMGAKPGGNSYGDVGERALGPFGRRCVEFSLVSSQLGFCCVYLSYVASNLRSVIMTITNCHQKPPVYILILSQLIPCILMAWVRRIRYFSITNLIADFLIIAGLLYIAVACTMHVVDPNDHSSGIVPFNPKHFALFLGTSVYVFEGIGLVLPLYDSLAPSLKPSFKPILTNCVLGLCVFFIFFGNIGYLAFGDDVMTAITLDLPAASAGSLTVQIGYCIALLLTFPLMLYPVTNILEPRIFPVSSHVDPSMKSRKNTLRAVMVGLTAVVSIFAGSALDNLVALIGGFCSVPLALVYPAICHHWIVGSNPTRDLSIAGFGLVLMVFATVMALISWSSEEQPSCTAYN